MCYLVYTSEGSVSRLKGSRVQGARVHLCECRTGIGPFWRLPFRVFLRHADLADVWVQVRRARLDLLVAGFGAVVVTYVIRAYRWQYLLHPIGRTRFRTAFRTTVIGFAALGVLPARAGDVLRPYLLARQEGLSTSATFATIVMERVLDLICGADAARALRVGHGRSGEPPAFAAAPD